MLSARTRKAAKGVGTAAKSVSCSPSTRPEASRAKPGRPSEDHADQVEQASANDGRMPDRDRSTPRHSGNGRSFPRSNGSGRVSGNGPDNVASTKQLNFLKALALQGGMGYQGLEDLAQREYGKDVLHLTKKEASALIDALRTTE